MAVAYLRVSTDEQENGPRAQRASIGAWARRNGVRIVRWRVEHVSGGAPLDERPRLLAALQDVRDLRAGLLVVAKRDRLARDVVIAATISGLARDGGARIVTADGVTTEDTPEGELLRGLLDLFAQYERRMIQARTKLAMLSKARRNEYTGGQTPFGHARDGGKTVPNEDEQAVVRWIVAEAAKGKGASAIARKLNEQAIPCRGSKWHKRSVQRILGRAATRATEVA